jgi:predicted NBD/HSP70 family sugar kinase
MMALEDFFHDEMQKAINKHILPVAAKNRELVKPARFTNDAVLLGGAALFS